MIGPYFIINCKAYAQGSGKRAVELARICERVAEEEEAEIIIAVPAIDIRRVAEAVSIPVFAQHVDPFTPGSHTGYVLPKQIKEAGAAGTLLNHAEHRLPQELLEKAVELCEQEELDTLICSPTPKDGGACALLQPWAVAYEDPELIGTGKAISQLQPEHVKEFAAAVKQNAIPLTGAGISKPADVQAALKLGTKGVLVASAVVKANDPERVLRELVA